jgi:alkyl hydroperoxide reductase subunit AhpC
MKKITNEQIIKWMQSDKYKDRFKAEYYQLKDRHEKLCAMIDKYRAGTLDFTPDCPIELLVKQKSAMTYYIRVLERRALIENIKL